MKMELSQAMKHQVSASENLEPLASPSEAKTALKARNRKRRAPTKKMISDSVVLSVVACALGACSVASTRQVTPITPLAPQIVSVDGQWVDSEGISTSSFRNGIFETRSADTFEKLSEGNYVMRADNLIDIEMRSLVRGTVSRVNCSLRHAPQVSQGTPQLLCTSQDGARFTLHRQEEGRVLPVRASF